MPCWKTAKKSSTYVQNPLFPTILADRRRCPPFQSPIFNSSTHHPGLSPAIAVSSRRIPMYFGEQRMGKMMKNTCNYHLETQ